MQHTAKIMFLTLTMLMITGGCVEKSAYLEKQAESDALRQEVAKMDEKNRNLFTETEKLTRENDALQIKLNKIKDEYQKIADEKKDLEASSLEFRKEATAKIGNLQQQNAELAGDKQMLNESIALLKMNKEKEVKKVSGTYETLLEKMEKEIQQGQIAITELKGKLTLDVLDKILFDSGKTEIKPEGLEVLDRVVEILAAAEDKAIRVEGHTDNVRIGGALAKKYPTNWELSAARALTVVRYLEKQGLDPRILSAVAFGENQPLADNETPEGRARNRRIAIVLQPRE